MVLFNFQNIKRMHHDSVWSNDKFIQLVYPMTLWIQCCMMSFIMPGIQTYRIRYNISKYPLSHVPMECMSWG